ncbi:MAG TPA: hypothetical protein VML96_05615 [Egibacteraceae bacterium]|nr:hypothetical protein [Egibacteraceae bacterium]
MAIERVRVWIEGDGELQHLAAPPEDDTAHGWDGETICARRGHLRWVLPEHVDAAKACAECAALEGHAPRLEGEYPGPV